MPASEAPITGKVRKKSSSGLTTIGHRRGVQGATTEINHFGELGTEATTFGQGDLQGSANADSSRDKPPTVEETTVGATTVGQSTPPAPVTRVAAADSSAKSKRKRRASPSE